MRRIQNIWDEGLEVKIDIIRHNLASEDEADHAEGACIAVLSLSQNGMTYNLNSGPRSVGHGHMSIDDVEMLNAPPVNLSEKYNSVFIFNSNADHNDAEALYEAVRGDWRVTEANRNLKSSLAVVLSRGVSKAIYEIERWEPVGDKFRFVRQQASDDLSNQFVNKNWSNIIGQTPGFWQRGQYLIVNFKGNGKFQFVRGLTTDDCFDLVAKKSN